MVVVVVVGIALHLGARATSIKRTVSCDMRFFYAPSSYPAESARARIKPFLKDGSIRCQGIVSPYGPVFEVRVHECSPGVFSLRERGIGAALPFTCCAIAAFLCAAALVLHEILVREGSLSAAVDGLVIGSALCGVVLAMPTLALWLTHRTVVIENGGLEIRVRTPSDAFYRAAKRSQWCVMRCATTLHGGKSSFYGFCVVFATPEQFVTLARCETDAQAKAYGERLTVLTGIKVYESEVTIRAPMCYWGVKM